MREWVWLQLADAGVSFALLLLGFAGILWECTAPGWIAPGVLGLVLATLAFAALPKIVSAWLLVTGGLVLIAFAARFGQVWRGAAWGAVLLTGAGIKWGIPLPQAAYSAIPFAVSAAILWKISHRARANKKL